MSAGLRHSWMSLSRWTTVDENREMVVESKARLATDRFLRKVWLSVAITVAFIAATILLISLPASSFTDPAAREYIAGIARVIVGLIVFVIIRQRNWGFDVLSSPSARAWGIILPVAVYSLIVYPLLFTGTLALNLSEPNLVGGVALNGFAAGTLEELVFRGLILSLLLGANSHNQRLNIVWRGILISALLFSMPHALNIFAGHAGARVVAQLVWSFLLGIVFSCLRIVGRSVWPVAVLHGAMNAFVHVNRLGGPDRAISVRRCRVNMRPTAIVHLWRDSIA
jgi:membrane protease YdiL (CAAX protease family)